VTLFDPPAAAEAKADGIAAADEHARAAWRADAERAIEQVARSCDYFTADEVWQELADTSTAWTQTPAALGPLILAAARRGLIRKTDMRQATKIPRRHHDLIVWESLVCGSPVTLLHPSVTLETPMTTNPNPSLSLDELPPAIDMTRRDQYGRYMIVAPGESSPWGYTRVTTVAKALDNGGGLAPWKATMTAVGLMLRRGLRAQWEALVAEYDGDPWYASDTSKAACKRLVEECCKVGGATDRAEIGTSLHTITALIDVGKTPHHLSPETERDVNAYVQGLIDAGVTIVEGAIELTVVLDGYRVAGTFDRLVRVPGFTLPLIADLKTGADLSYSWPSIAVQLAAYSRADAVYVQGAAADGSQDIRQPMPEVDQEHALVMYLNAGTGLLELHLVDIAQGWEAFKLSMSARKWSDVSGQLAIPLGSGRFATADGDLTSLLEQSVALVEAAKAESAEATVDTDPELRAAVRDWLRRRVKLIGEHAEARAWLGGEWPADLPFLHKSDEHTTEQLLDIELLLDAAEARYDLPFGESKPGDHSVGMARLLHLFPGSTEVAP
jgi:hypothetical protein